MRALFPVAVSCASALVQAQAQPQSPVKLPVSWRDGVRAGHPPASSACPSSIDLIRISAPVVQTTVALGTERCEAVPTGLHQREIFTGESRLLGIGLLSRYGVTMDVARGRVVLE